MRVATSHRNGCPFSLFTRLIDGKSFIPDHTHNITYGIYSGSTADSLVVSVDNTSVGTFQKSISDLNLVDYLAKDDSGNIRRGWHTIEITPDKLSRVECDLVIQLFANSRGGGQF